MPIYSDMRGIPESGMPVLKDVYGRATVDGLNPKLATGFLYHTTATGALSIQTPVISMNSADSYLSFSPSNGTVSGYFNLYQAAQDMASYGYLVPYTGATTDVNLGYQLIKSTDSSSGNYDYMYLGGQNQFTTNYSPVDPYTVYGSYQGATAYFSDLYGDGTLWDSGGSFQIGTIDYATGYVDTTSYNSDLIDDIGYSYSIVGYESFLSYNGSAFANGISVTKDNAGFAGYFSDGSNVVTLCDGTWAGTFYDGSIYYYIGGGYAFTDNNTWYINSAGYFQFPTYNSGVMETGGNYGTGGLYADGASGAGEIGGTNGAGYFTDYTNSIIFCDGTNPITVNGSAGYTGDLNDSTSTKIADVVGGIITAVYY